jgi:hypothetical protein
MGGPLGLRGCEDLVEEGGRRVVPPPVPLQEQGRSHRNPGDGRAHMEWAGDGHGDMLEHIRVGRSWQASTVLDRGHAM